MRMQAVRACVELPARGRGGRRALDRTLGVAQEQSACVGMPGALAPHAPARQAYACSEGSSPPAPLPPLHPRASSSLHPSHLHPSHPHTLVPSAPLHPLLARAHHTPTDQDRGVAPPGRRVPRPAVELPAVEGAGDAEPRVRGVQGGQEAQGDRGEGGGTGASVTWLVVMMWGAGAVCWEQALSRRACALIIWWLHLPFASPRHPPPTAGGDQ